MALFNIPDSNGTTFLANINAALNGLQIHGQCRLNFVSSSSIRLDRFNGSMLMINGAMQQIPSAGVSLSSTGLTATTRYFIYAYMNGSTMTLEASATGHSTDSTTGVEIKTGDSSRTLVGQVYIKTAATFADSLTQRFVASWFNPVQAPMSNGFTAARNLPVTSWGEPNTEIRLEWVSFANKCADLSASIPSLTGGTASTIQLAIGVDSTSTPEDCAVGATSGISGSSSYFHSTSHKKAMTEGYHYATILGYYTAGSGVACVGAASGSPRTTLKAGVLI